MELVGLDWTSGWKTYAELKLYIKSPANLIHGDFKFM